MLNKVKSLNILNKIFNYIKEIEKFKLIEYNKKLQNKLNINLTEYQTISGKYIIFETKEKGREYNAYNNCVIFEGEYLNKKRNGKGKEYYYNDLIFEGEYKNGKRNGKGKEYDLGNLIFEGEYLNGKKWNGIGYYNKNQKSNQKCNDNKSKFFDSSFEKEVNNKIYEIINGTGLVKEYFDNNLIFEGEYKYGERNGKGKEYNRNGNVIYIGEYLNGKRWNGKGFDTKNNNIYELKKGQGYVKEYYLNNKIKFECEFVNGEKNGKGKEYYINDKLEFDGEYKDGKRHGKGKEYDYNGNLIFEGNFLYNNKYIGKEYIKGKLEYKGEYLLNKKWNGEGYDENGNLAYKIKNGTGVIKYYANNQLIFEGFWKKGKKDGKCKEYNCYEELIFEGEYKDDIRNGKGKEKNYNGKLIFEGEYLDGKKWKGIYCEYDKYDSLIFEGNYENGDKNGKGKIFQKNNIVFEGEFFNGKRWNGNGYDIKGNQVYTLKNGNGFVKEYYSNNTISLEGGYKNGEKNGFIKIYNYSGNLIFEGEYLDGKRNGRGKEYDSRDDEILLFSFNFTENDFTNLENNIDDKEKDIKKDKGQFLIFEGEYKNGLRNGKGKEYKDGALIYEGEYLNGLRISDIEKKIDNSIINNKDMD